MRVRSRKTAATTAPGPRKGEMTDYFGAFIRDPDGNKVEAMTIPAPSQSPRKP